MEKDEDDSDLFRAAVKKILPKKASKATTAWWNIAAEWYLLGKPLNTGGGRAIWPAYQKMREALELEEQEVPESQNSQEDDEESVEESDE